MGSGDIFSSRFKRTARPATSAPFIYLHHQISAFSVSLRECSLFLKTFLSPSRQGRKEKTWEKMNPSLPFFAFFAPLRERSFLLKTFPRQAAKNAEKRLERPNPSLPFLAFFAPLREPSFLLKHFLAKPPRTQRKDLGKAVLQRSLVRYDHRAIPCKMDLTFMQSIAN